MEPLGHKIVRLSNGAYSVHSLDYGETCHPAIGPIAEAEALYVRQLKLRERLKGHEGRFVIWDVGLGAGANVLTALREIRDIPSDLHLFSFDNTVEPLRFALKHSAELGYLSGFESVVGNLLNGAGPIEFINHRQSVRWTLHVGDFPSFVEQQTMAAGTRIAAPDAILFDAYSPKKNPAMWTAPLFANLFRLLDPQHPCALATYSRSTMFRVALLLAGFFVGAGHATGQKEETTIAANTLELLDEPLPRSWLERARKSISGEPMWEAVYRQAPITTQTLEKLTQHPQFQAP